jgi:hypothetical protein
MSERHPEEANHRLEQTKSPLYSSKRQHKKKKTQMIPGKRKPRRQPRKEKNSN